jgi:hypothetical protein
MDTYSHVIPTLRSGTAARVDRLFATPENSDSLEDSLEVAGRRLTTPEQEFVI